MKSEKPLRETRETRPCPSTELKAMRTPLRAKEADWPADLDKKGGWRRTPEKGRRAFSGSQRVEADSGEPEYGKSWHPGQDGDYIQRTCVPDANS